LQKVKSKAAEESSRPNDYDIYASITIYLWCIKQKINFFYLLTTKIASTIPLQSMAKIKEKVLLITGSNSCKYDRPRKHCLYRTRSGEFEEIRRFLHIIKSRNYISMMLRLYRKVRTIWVLIALIAFVRKTDISYRISLTAVKLLFSNSSIKLIRFNPWEVLKI